MKKGLQNEGNRPLKEFWLHKNQKVPRANESLDSALLKFSRVGKTNGLPFLNKQFLRSPVKTKIESGIISGLWPELWANTHYLRFQLVNNFKKKKHLN